MMRVKPMVARAQVTSAWQDLKEGLCYIWDHSIIRTLIALVSVTGLFGLGYSTLFPDWAGVVLGGDATTNGWLQLARGAGSLIGALMIASLGRFKFKGKLLTTGSYVFPLALILFALMHLLPLFLLVLLILGWGYMVLFNMANILVQSTSRMNFGGGFSCSTSRASVRCGNGAVPRAGTRHLRIGGARRRDLHCGVQ
jgi:predicted MFS family arabinose efflux permease